MPSGPTSILGHSARHAIQLTIQITLAAVLCALLLVLAERHNHRFDLTPTQSFVLSDESERIAGNLKIPIRIIAFYNAQEHEQRRQMQDLLQLFAAASSNITFRLLDLDREPALAKKYGVGSFNTGVLEAGGKLHELKSIDEEEILNALLRLTRRRQRVLCFLTGHGEHSPQDASDRTGYSEVAKALEKEGFDIKTLPTVPSSGVPAECTVVILPGPTRDLLPGEGEQLSRYLDDGGRVLLMVDPDAPASVTEFLARYGVRAGEDLVVDERNRFYGADSFMPRVPIFDEGTFHKNLDAAAVFAVARTVVPTEPAPPGMHVLLLALTSNESWARVDGGTVPEGTPRFRREMDKPGPLPVGVMVTNAPAAGGRDVAGSTDNQKVSRMIVFGDSDFASNLYLNLLGNKDLFMSSLGVLAEDQELVAVRRKGLPRSSLSPISLTAQQGRLLFWIAVVVSPGCCVALGFFITWQRRRRASA
jgi:ABC-type uncharacterized transport system involved in gliding motility auxiliary subunit